jgi:Ca-activated chloride channel family protein
MIVEAPAPSSPAPRSRSRRGVLLVAACSLLAVGIGINVHRRVAIPEEELELGYVEQLVVVNETRFVGYMNQYDDVPEPEDLAYENDEEAGGQGQRHKGEAGVMGRPTTRQKSGLYAMRGPSNAIPQMARNFDPAMASRNAGILGVMQQESGHFLASPYGGAFSIGNDDEDVWGGLTGEELAGVSVPAVPAWDPGEYAEWVEQTFVEAAEDPTSTFSIDVDTGSYSLVRRHLVDYRSLPAPEVVRIEEMINYFDYDYPEPSGAVPVSITTELGPCPWDETHQLVHVGLQGKHVAPAAVPPRNLVFLVDVSGSMSEELPLVISSLTDLTEQLGERDRIGIVVYAGESGTVLSPTVGTHKAEILDALEQLEAGGGTNGGEGIEHAYALAQEHFVEGGVNRVVLATDGDFNVGVTSHEALVELIEAKRRSGVFLSVLGFGGANYNDGMMEQLADKGNGNYAYIDGMAEARKVLVEEVGGTLVTIAKDVKIQVDFDPGAVERYRLVGYTNRVLADRDFADDTKDAGEIGSGHTVTALYEIEPAAEPERGADVMQLKLRYKQPDGERSRLIEVSVPNEPVPMTKASDDFRFSAAVAGFGQVLQGLPTGTPQGSLLALRDLAEHARGDDPTCRRAELVQLIEQAIALQGQPLGPTISTCVMDQPKPLELAPPLPHADEPEPAAAPTPGEAFDWQRFVLEVLYLLPPLLALPLFVMALRRPRRRDE